MGSSASSDQSQFFSAQEILVYGGLANRTLLIGKPGLSSYGPYPPGRRATSSSLPFSFPEAEVWSTWNDLSNELSQAIQIVGKSIVTVQAGGGRTASGIVVDEKTVLTTARAVADEDYIFSNNIRLT